MDIHTNKRELACEMLERARCLDYSTRGCLPTSFRRFAGPSFRRRQGDPIGNRFILVCWNVWLLSPWRKGLGRDESRLMQLSVQVARESDPSLHQKGGLWLRATLRTSCCLHSSYTGGYCEEPCHANAQPLVGRVARAKSAYCRGNQPGCVSECQRCSNWEETPVTRVRPRITHKVCRSTSSTAGSNNCSFRCSIQFAIADLANISALDFDPHCSVWLLFSTDLAWCMFALASSG